MRSLLLIGIGAGAASALLFYSAARGSPILGVLLPLLTPLPTLLIGIGWGWLSAAVGAVTSSLILAIAAGPPAAIVYLIAFGVPAAVIAYLAYLSRPDPQDSSQREWYPVGRLLAGVALYGGALPVLALPLLGGSYEIMRAPMSEFFRRLSARAPELGLRPLNDTQIEALAEFVVAVLPGTLAAYWVAILAINLYLAGRIARASGRLGRNWPDLPALAYPPGFPLLLGLALAVAWFVPGTIGVAGASFTGALLVAYLVAGLALMHFLARHRAAWVLWFVYAGLVLFTPYAMVALMVAGLLEPALKLRARFGASPPPST
jgi:Predicted membrane protein (DUF2232)